MLAGNMSQRQMSLSDDVLLSQGTNIYVIRFLLIILTLIKYFYIKYFLIRLFILLKHWESLNYNDVLTLLPIRFELIKT